MEPMNMATGVITLDTSPTFATMTCMLTPSATTAVGMLGMGMGGSLHGCKSSVRDFCFCHINSPMGHRIEFLRAYKLMNARVDADVLEPLHRRRLLHL